MLQSGRFEVSRESIQGTVDVYSALSRVMLYLSGEQEPRGPEAPLLAPVNLGTHQGLREGLPIPSHNVHNLIVTLTNPPGLVDSRSRSLGHINAIASLETTRAEDLRIIVKTRSRGIKSI